jgi:putative transcriptional regulator
MTISHHPANTHLMAHAAGLLPEAFGLIVATHVSMCDECRAQLCSFEALGGAVLDGCAGADMSSSSLEATLARIDAQPDTDHAAPGADDAAQSQSDLPAPLRNYVGCDLESVQWRPVGMGVRQVVLPTGDGATARLLHIPAGQVVPEHGHNGLEMTLVLRGAFCDHADRFGPGDVEIATKGFDHAPMADPGQDCICLAATDAPLRFNGLLPRLAQPFLQF